MTEKVKVVVYCRPKNVTQSELSSDARWRRWRDNLDSYTRTGKFVNKETIRWFDNHNMCYQLQYEENIRGLSSQTTVILDSEEEATLFMVQFGDSFYV